MATKTILCTVEDGLTLHIPFLHALHARAHALFETTLGNFAVDILGSFAFRVLE